MRTLIDCLILRPPPRLPPTVRMHAWLTAGWRAVLSGLARRCFSRAAAAYSSSSATPGLGTGGGATEGRIDDGGVTGSQAFEPAPPARADSFSFIPRFPATAFSPSPCDTSAEKLESISIATVTMEHSDVCDFSTALEPDLSCDDAEHAHGSLNEDGFGTASEPKVTTTTTVGIEENKAKAAGSDSNYGAGVSMKNDIFAGATKATSDGQVDQNQSLKANNDSSVNNSVIFSVAQVVPRSALRQNSSTSVVNAEAPVNQPTPRRVTFSPAAVASKNRHDSLIFPDDGFSGSGLSDFDERLAVQDDDDSSSYRASSRSPSLASLFFLKDLSDKTPDGFPRCVDTFDDICLS